MDTQSNPGGWKTAAVLTGRMCFAAVFAMALVFKVMDIDGTAEFIAAAGLPIPKVLAWLAAAFELVLVVCLLSGAYFSEASLLAAAYVLFLAFAFHGPSRWADANTEFGFFVDHISFIAGLLFAAAHGPGSVLALRKGLLEPGDRAWDRHRTELERS